MKVDLQYSVCHCAWKAQLHEPDQIKEYWLSFWSASIVGALDINIHGGQLMMKENDVSNLILVCMQGW